MRRIELIPAALAVAGLTIPLVGSGWVVWPLTTVWAVIVILFAVWRIRFGLRSRTSVAVLVIALPILFLAGWEGGWWMIPVAVAQLVIDARVGDRRPEGDVSA
jgi:hypothetical protein